MILCIKNLILKYFKLTFIVPLIFCLIFMIRIAIYSPKDKILFTKFINLKIQYVFRFFILFLSLYLAFETSFINNEIVIGVYASAIVWGIVEIISTFLKDCATYESEKEVFCSELYEKLGNAKSIVKIEPNNIDYEKLKDKIYDLYNVIIDTQYKSSIYILSDEYLGIHNYIAAILENCETFYKKNQDKLKEIFIIDNKTKINNDELENELKIETIDKLVIPTFFSESIYKFHGMRTGNEGDIVNKISIEMPKSIKHLCTFKPTFDIDKYINTNSNPTYKQILKILFRLKWFK